MLFRSHLYDGIRSGDITVAFRRWKRPTVSEGGTLRTAVGVLHIDELTVIEPDDITLADARAAGFDSPDDVLASLTSGPGRQLRRVRFTSPATTRASRCANAPTSPTPTEHRSTLNSTAGTMRATTDRGRGSCSTSSTGTPANGRPTSRPDSTSTSTS